MVLLNSRTLYHWSLFIPLYLDCCGWRNGGGREEVPVRGGEEKKIDRQLHTLFCYWCHKHLQSFIKALICPHNPVRGKGFTSRNWWKTGKRGHVLPSSKASMDLAVSMSKLLWSLS